MKREVGAFKITPHTGGDVWGVEYVVGLIHNRLLVDYFDMVKFILWLEGDDAWRMNGTTEQRRAVARDARDLLSLQFPELAAMETPPMFRSRGTQLQNYVRLLRARYGATVNVQRQPVKT